MLKRVNFPEHLKKIRNLMPRLLSILEDGAPENWYASVWLEESLGYGVTAGKMENVSRSADRGMVFRILAGGILHEKGLNDLEEASLLEAARQFRNDVESHTKASPGIIPAYKPLSWQEELKNPLSEEILSQIPEGVNETSWVHFSPLCEINPWDTNIEVLLENARDIRKKVFDANLDYITDANKKLPEDKKLEPLADARVMCRQTIKTHIFVDSMKNISQTLPVSLIYPMGTSKSGHSGRSILGGLGGLEITVPSEDDIKQAAVLPLLLAGAEKIKPGRYKVITGPDVTGVIAHEAFGHTQEGDTCMKGRSIAVELREKGVRVGNEQASIVNYGAVTSMDSFAHGSNGSYYFDHEGQLSRPQEILKEGYLSSPMADLTSSLVLGIPRTSNGKRESWRRPLMTRQTNTYFTPGDKTVEEMISMVDDGFLARYAHGGMEDPKGGSLTAGTEYLEEIKDGRLTGRIFLGPSGGHVELSDPVFQLLERIVARSSTSHPEKIPENKFGGCGKYHKESVEAGCGGPYILWESINCG